MVILGFQVPSTAQESNYERPNWYFGAAAGANFNFYRGTTQQLNAGFTAPSGFHEGEGTGLFIAPLVEYHFSNSVWGIMLQTGYDSRKGQWDQEISPCDCPMDLSSDLSYLSIEPSLRLAPFKNSLYFYAGPRLGFTLDESFSYKKDSRERNEDFDQMESSVISMQLGAGYDILLSSRKERSQFVLSPFVSFQPYLGQYPRSIESWNITTIRVGAALKFGRGSKSAPQEIEVPEITFSINSPANVPTKGTTTESFPFSNYIYFNENSTVIPNRYVFISSEETDKFSEKQVDISTPVDFTGRSKRQMTVYYSVLNILGDRMLKNPLSSITLVGSSKSGPENGKEMAASVKNYLINVFSIGENRIAIEGRTEPKTNYGQSVEDRELELLSEGDRRVSIESNSPALLREFQNGPDSPSISVKAESSEAPVESYVVFNVEGASEAFTFWTLQINDEHGNEKNFGPFTQDAAKISGKDILGAYAEGDVRVTMTGTRPSGEIFTEESTVKVVKWVPAENTETNRFSILYEFNDSIANPGYEKYLSEVVVPKIPRNGLVVIHGYTDVIGQKERNQELSLARANDVRKIIEEALLKANRDDVTFDVHGSGEDEAQAPFENELPEERTYNRTVIIDLKETI